MQLMKRRMTRLAFQVSCEFHFWRNRTSKGKTGVMKECRRISRKRLKNTF